MVSAAIRAETRSKSLPPMLWCQALRPRTGCEPAGRGGLVGKERDGVSALRSCCDQPCRESANGGKITDAPGLFGPGPRVICTGHVTRFFSGPPGFGPLNEEPAPHETCAAGGCGFRRPHPFPHWTVHQTGPYKLDLPSCDGLGKKPSGSRGETAFVRTSVQRGAGKTFAWSQAGAATHPITISTGQGRRALRPG